MERKMDEDQMKFRYIMFENETNSCWLDASVSLIVHNRTFKKMVELSPDSQINKIISSYDEAINTLNISDSVEQKLKTKEMLRALQVNTLEYLKKYLNFKSGKPDSAVCALLGLIYQDKSNIREQLNVSWIWKKHCTNCDTNSQYTTYQKPIITLPKVTNFHPECPSSFYMCTCKSEQEMELIYKELPPCLIFHFENGAGTGTNVPTSFPIKGREYQLTGIVILEKSFLEFSPNHFYTFIRNPFNNSWLECNDLEKKCITFSPAKPEINLKDVYMYVFEAFDNLDKIIDYDALIDQGQQVENADIEVIDLSDENDGSYNTDTSSKTIQSKSRKFITDDKATEDINYYKVCSDLEKCSVYDKNYKPPMFTKSLKTCSDVKLEESKKYNSQDVASNLKLHVNFPCNDSESISKIVDSENTPDEFTKAKKNDYSKHTIAGVLFTNEREKNCGLTYRNETFATQNFKASSSQQSTSTKNASNFSCLNVSTTNFKSTSKNLFDKHGSEVKSENNQGQIADKLKKSETDVIDSQEYKVKNASDLKGKRVYFPSEKNSVDKNEIFKKNNITYCIDSKQSTFAVTNLQLPDNFFSSACKLKKNSKNLNSQGKIAFKSVKEFENEKTHYLGRKITNDSIENKKENFSNPLACVAEKTTAVHEELSSSKTSIHDKKIPSAIFKDNSKKKPDQVDECNRGEMQMKGLNSQGKIAFESVKEFENEKTHYLGRKITNDSIENKKENFSNPLACVAEKTTAVHKERTSCKTPIHDKKIPSTVFKDNSDKKQDKVDEYNKEKMKMDLKRNEYESVKSDVEKGVEIEDNNSSKKKERIDDKCVSSNQGNDNQATTSYEITNNIFQRAKRASDSADKDYYGKRVKMSDVKNCSEKSNEKLSEESDDTNDKQSSQNDASKAEKEKFKNMVNDCVEQTLANFFAKLYNIF